MELFPLIVHGDSPILTSSPLTMKQPKMGLWLLHSGVIMTSAKMAQSDTLSLSKEAAQWGMTYLYRSMILFGHGLR